MENSAKQKSAYTPKTGAELIAEFSGVTKVPQSVKRSRQTLSRTAEKFQPLPFAEILKTVAPAFMSAKVNRATPRLPDKRKGWNSSVKLDKKTSHLKNGHLKTSNARKVLDFQPNVHPKQNSRVTTLPTETPKFIKPQYKAKKSIHLAAKPNLTRISGVCKIQETPQETIKPSKITEANKENTPSYKNKRFPPVILPPREQCNAHRQTRPQVNIQQPTPVKNDLWKSNCDDSFLQTEKELQHIIDQEKGLLIKAKEDPIPNIFAISPPNATPFNDYRAVDDKTRNEKDDLDILEVTAAFDDTIMIFDKPSSAEYIKEDSIITSLCDLFKNATVKTKTPKKNNEILTVLREVSTELEKCSIMIDNINQMKTELKHSNTKICQCIKRLIKQMENDGLNIDEEKTFSQENTSTPIKSKNVPTTMTLKSPILSPNYKIPKKNSYLKKKVFHKSMPNISEKSHLSKRDNKALDMYMKMKNKMMFLKTPVKQTSAEAPDTPVVMSRNLQEQLEKLYNGS